MVSEAFKCAIGRGLEHFCICSLCGRKHFSSRSDGNGLEATRLKDLQVESQKHPNQYVDHGTEMVWYGCLWGDISHKTIVMDCPCGKLAEVEQNLLQHFPVITGYLRMRLEQDLNEVSKRRDEVLQIAEMVR